MKIKLGNVYVYIDYDANILTDVKKELINLNKLYSNK